MFVDPFEFDRFERQYLDWSVANTVSAITHIQYTITQFFAPPPSNVSNMPHLSLRNNQSQTRLPLKPPKSSNRQLTQSWSITTTENKSWACMNRHGHTQNELTTYRYRGVTAAATASHQRVLTLYYEEDLVLAIAREHWLQSFGFPVNACMFCFGQRDCQLFDY